MAVLDAGTGSGILAVLAAKAGARIVYAVDNSDMLDTAKAVFQASAVTDRVVAIRGDFRTIALPEKVDVIISETFGALGVAEGGMEDLVDARRLLNEGGRFLPERMELFMAPVDDRTLFDETVGIFGPIHGAELSPLRPTALRRGTTSRITPSSLQADGVMFRSVRLGEVPYGTGTAVFPRLRPGQCVGFAAWFDLVLTRDVTLSTSPSAAATHWHQQFLPIEPFPLSTAPELNVELTLESASDDRRGIELSAFGRLDGVVVFDAHFRLR